MTAAGMAGSATGPLGYCDQPQFGSYRVSPTQQFHTERWTAQRPIDGLALLRHLVLHPQCKNESDDHASVLLVGPLKLPPEISEQGSTTIGRLVQQDIQLAFCSHLTRDGHFAEGFIAPSDTTTRFMFLNLYDAAGNMRDRTGIIQQMLSLLETAQ
jgi:hypothetical protein